MNNALPLSKSLPASVWKTNNSTLLHFLHSTVESSLHLPVSALSKSSVGSNAQKLATEITDCVNNITTSLYNSFILPPENSSSYIETFYDNINKYLHKYLIIEASTLMIQDPVVSPEKPRLPSTVFLHSLYANQDNTQVRALFNTFHPLSHFINLPTNTLAIPISAEHNKDTILKLHWIADTISNQHVLPTITDYIKAYKDKITALDQQDTLGEDSSSHITALQKYKKEKYSFQQILNDLQRVNFIDVIASPSDKDFVYDMYCNPCSLDSAIKLMHERSSFIWKIVSQIQDLDITSSEKILLYTKIIGFHIDPRNPTITNEMLDIVKERLCNLFEHDPKQPFPTLDFTTPTLNNLHTMTARDILQSPIQQQHIVNHDNTINNATQNTPTNQKQKFKDSSSTSPSTKKVNLYPTLEDDLQTSTDAIATATPTIQKTKESSSISTQTEPQSPNNNEKTQNTEKDMDISDKVLNPIRRRPRVIKKSDPNLPKTKTLQIKERESSSDILHKKNTPQSTDASLPTKNKESTKTSFEPTIISSKGTNAPQKQKNKIIIKRKRAENYSSASPIKKVKINTSKDTQQSQQQENSFVPITLVADSTFGDDKKLPTIDKTLNALLELDYHLKEIQEPKSEEFMNQIHHLVMQSSPDSSEIDALILDVLQTYPHLMNAKVIPAMENAMADVIAAIDTQSLAK